MKYLKSFLWFIIPFIIISLIVTILYYFNLINENIYIYTRFIMSLLSLFIGGLYLGRHSLKKGWLEGLKFGGIIIVFLTIIYYVLFGFCFSMRTFIYYLILLLSSVLGSMFGIRNVEKI